MDKTEKRGYKQLSGNNESSSQDLEAAERAEDQEDLRMLEEMRKKKLHFKKLDTFLGGLKTMPEVYHRHSGKET
ncbi:MAG: hypothetical protein RDV48_29710 [Candidatus Eremiobacteraeota bacterium]|nr:hypothetical protein [Candidatus Eremiobacteraeota bacterium]